MSRLLILLTLSISLSACYPLPTSIPELDEPRVRAVIAPDLAPLREELRRLHQDLASLSTRVEGLEPLTARIARLETLTLAPATAKKKGAAKSSRAVPLVQLVSTAQKEALVQPTEATYFGRTADARYTWQPGLIYPILVAPGAQTMITLPPKEVLLIGLALRDEEFLVVNKKAGREDAAHYVISITPQDGAKGVYDVAMLTDNGHKYNLKLIVGTESNRSVTFEVPTIHEDAR